MAKVSGYPPGGWIDTDVRDGVVECSLSQFSMEGAAVARAFCDDAVGLEE